MIFMIVFWEEVERIPESNGQEEPRMDRKNLRRNDMASSKMNWKGACECDNKSHTVNKSSGLLLECFLCDLVETCLLKTVSYFG